jgi:hypothetical protein
VIPRLGQFSVECRGLFTTIILAKCLDHSLDIVPYVLFKQFSDISVKCVLIHHAGMRFGDVAGAVNQQRDWHRIYTVLLRQVFIPNDYGIVQLVFLKEWPHGFPTVVIYSKKPENPMPTKKRSPSPRSPSTYGKAAGKSVESAMRREKKGTLRSGKGGKGGKVTSRKQAIAIGLSEARKKGAKVPKKKNRIVVGAGGGNSIFP